MKKNKRILISVPQPCSEDWNKMTPQEQGRFCDACQKCVVDFTKYSDEQLLNFFTQKNAKNTCGRFREDQLDRKIFVPPTRSKYYQWFISLGFIIFLTNLLGIEAKAQEPVKKEWSADQKNNKAKGSIQGTILDENGEPAISATVQVLQGGIMKSGNVTDFDGNYVIKPLTPGTYELSVKYTGYNESLIKEVLVSPNKPTEVNVTITPKPNSKDGIVITSKWEPPLIDKFGAGDVAIMTGGADIEPMPVRKPALMLGGVSNNHSNFETTGDNRSLTDYNMDMPQNKGSIWDWLRGIKHD